MPGSRRVNPGEPEVFWYRVAGRVNPERRRCLVPGEPEGLIRSAGSVWCRVAGGVIRSAGERMPYGTDGACVRSNVPVPRECRLSAIPPDIR